MPCAEIRFFVRFGWAKISGTSVAGFTGRNIIGAMKIVLISNYLPDNSQSMLRYARMLEWHLRERGHEVSLVHPPAILGKARFLSRSVGKWIGYIDKYLLAPPYLQWRCRKADVVHVCDHSNSMYLSCARRKPKILTCHDLIAINSARGMYEGVRVRSTGRVQQRWIAAGIRSSPNLICVSEKTKEDVLELAPQIRAEITVIHHPLNFDFHPSGAEEVRRALEGIGLPADTEYFLHVGGNQWYKNRLGALKIFAELKRMPRFERTRLVMAGKPLSREMLAFRRSSLGDDAVLEAIDISDRDLRAFYTGALAFLFPSREEGFGWPILEAQACGCPVVTTNRGPMKEIAGDAAVLIDPGEPAEAAEKVARALANRDQLRAMGFRNAARFTVDRAIDAYVEVYANAIVRKPERVGVQGSL